MTRFLQIACLILVLAVWTAGTLRAQENAVTFAPVQTAGLAHTSIYAILQDHLGYLWFGTGAGLHRYDGYELMTYTHDPSDSTSLARNLVWSLVEDERGRLWVLNAAGVQIFDRRTGRFTAPLEGSERLKGKPPQVGKLVKGAAGTIWWIRRGQAPLRYDRRAQRLRPVDGVKQVRAFYEDADGVLWFSRERVGLYRYNPATGTTRYFEPPSDQSWVAQRPIDAIYQDRSGTYWIVTREGVGAFDPPSGRFTRRAELSPEASRSPAKIVGDENGTLWIGSLAELYRFDTATHDLTQPISSPDRDVWTIYPDRSGTVWVGMLGGLYRYSPYTHPFSHLQHEDASPNSLSSNLVTAIYEDPDRSGIVWVGTIGGGLNRIDRAGGGITHYLDTPTSSPCAGENIWSIHEDGADRLWLGTDCGLYRFDRNTGAFKSFLPRPDRRDDHLQNNIDVITEDARGRLWMGTYWGDLFRFDRGTEAFIRERKLAVPIRTLRTDQNGRLWIGTQGRGLMRMDLETRRLLRYPYGTDEKRSLNASHVWFIHQTADGILWIGTTLGLSRLDPETGTFTNFQEQDGLPNSIVYALLEDEAGRLWLSTNRGISCFDPHLPDGQQFRNFDARDGLGNTEFNRRAAFASRRGEFFFGGTHGLTSFFPDRIRVNPHVPPVVLTNVRKSSRDRTVSLNPFGREELVLSHRDYTVAFEFAALDYTNPRKNQYVYKLEDFDPNWRAADTRRFASYTNVPPGEYVFRVKGSNNDGIWNEEGAAVRLVVMPPFWQTWWFRLLVAVSVVGLLAGAYRYRIHQLMEMQRLRLRIAQDLHDDIGASLGSIVLMSDMVRRRFSSEGRDRRWLERIGRTAREMSADLQEIVWLVSPNHDRLDHLIQRMQQVTATLLAGIPHTFKAPDTGRVDTLEMAVRRNVLLIYKEILHNIVRHARASEVAIRVDKDDGRLVLRVTDDGVGFDPEVQHAGHGLANIQRRMEKVEGSITLESAPGQGTTITVTAKIT